MTMARALTSSPMAVAATLAALLVGCGGDDDAGGGAKPVPPGPAQPATGAQPAGGAPGAKAPAGGAAAPKRSAGGKKELALKTYAKVEEKAGNDDEAWALRREFKGSDLRDDPNGNDNRDPFRSFVIRQTVSNLPDHGITQTTPVCTERNMRAPNPEAQDPRARKSYALRDLRLGGIVLRGARSHALFVDTSGYGHLVRRDDCVGKEKARVTAIGAGYVTLEIIPEQGPGTAGGEPQQRKIELHPEELELDQETEADSAPGGAAGAPPAGGDPKEGSTDGAKQP